MTTPPPLTAEEPARLEALRRLRLMDTPLEERFERVTRLGRRLFDTDICAISLVESSRQFFKSIQGFDICGSSRDVSFCGHTILEDRVMLVPDARLDPRFASSPLVTGPPNIVFYAGHPLRSPEGLNIATLCVNHSAPMNFTSSDCQALCDLAKFAEAELHTVASSRIHAALVDAIDVERRRALVDPLTRMWNREGIREAAERLVGECRAGLDGGGLVMVDLDGFKQINDTLGHEAGDEVLRAAAKRMLTAVRETDSVGRLGGDEFLLVLSPCEDQRVAQGVATRVLEQLHGSPFDTSKGEVRLTASMGVAFVGPGERRELADLLESADRAMYDAKRAGKDTVCGESLPRAAA